jgi:hypothetical protein
MESVSHNRKVKTAIAEIQTQTDAAHSVEDLVQAVNIAAQLQQPLKYDHQPHYLAGAMLLLLSAGTGVYQYFASHLVNEFTFVLMVIPVIAAIVIFGYSYGQNRSLRGLSDQIYLKNLLFDNALEIIEVNPEAEAKALERQFDEFDRGNHSRKIEALYKGRYQGERHAFDYRYFHFHYVDKEVTTRTDSNGKTRTETTYHHYNRYGVYLDFPFVSSLKIVSDSPSFWKKNQYRTASNQFNRLFNVYAAEEMIAARFLKPAIIVALEEFCRDFKAVNLEFNDRSALCLSFKNGELFARKRSYGLDSPNLFIEELREQHLSDGLQQVLGLINNLMTHSDSNFTR